jgi:Tol biopolymer transport system component
VKNEAISEGETHLLQPGKNGLEEITYRVIEEEGSGPWRVPVQRTVVIDPIPEIMMIGTQRGYIPLTFPGKITFVSAQNAWIIDGETGSRKPIVSTGDLDGRILELSPDGRWLLFTRQKQDSQNVINSLWLIDLLDPGASPIDLEVENIIHYAEWYPLSPSEVQTYTIGYSTVEARSSPPGWQANNDLHVLRITEGGIVYDNDTIIETNSGGQYGWWGTKFRWSPDGNNIAFSRADSIGFVNFDENTLEPVIEITPYQTLSDWAWIPPIDWGPNSDTLYFIDHGEPTAFESPEASQTFHVMAFSFENSTIGPLVRKTGMFSHLATSPEAETLSGESAYSVAFLQAIQPLESETSDYRLMLMDHDGSNQIRLFPPEGDGGLQPGSITWAPDGSRTALIYENNLWIIDPIKLISQPITSESQTTAFDWSH